MAYTTLAQAARNAEVLAKGRWYESQKVDMAHLGSDWMGICGKCGASRPAIGLELVRLPFGKGEIWKCAKGGCQ